MKLRIFRCDWCTKESQPVNEMEGHHEGKEIFPYSQGWIYAYNVELKIALCRILSNQDQHFCSTGCLNKFYTNMVKSCRKKDEKANQKKEQK